MSIFVEYDVATQAMRGVTNASSDTHAGPTASDQTHKDCLGKISSVDRLAYVLASLASRDSGLGPVGLCSSRTTAQALLLRAKEHAKLQVGCSSTSELEPAFSDLMDRLLGDAMLQRVTCILEKAAEGGGESSARLLHVCPRSWWGTEVAKLLEQQGTGIGSARQAPCPAQEQPEAAAAAAAAAAAGGCVEAETDKQKEADQAVDLACLDLSPRHEPLHDATPKPTARPPSVLKFMTIGSNPKQPSMAGKRATSSNSIGVSASSSLPLPPSQQPRLAPQPAAAPSPATATAHPSGASKDAIPPTSSPHPLEPVPGITPNLPSPLRCHALPAGHTPPLTSAAISPTPAQSQLQALLDPALAKAMLPRDPSMPDYLTRLKHGLARDYGYAGPHEGWQAKINNHDAAADGPKKKPFDVRYEVCNSKGNRVVARSIPEVARKLGLVATGQQEVVQGPSGQGQLQGHGRAPKQYQQQQQQQQQQQGPVQLGSRVDASGEGGTLQGGAGQGSNRASDSSSMRGSRMLESQGKDGKSRKRRLTAAEASSPHALALFQAWRRPHTLQDMLRARQQALRRSSNQLPYIMGLAHICVKMAMQSEGWMAPGFGCPPPFKLFVAPEVAPPAAQPSASDPSPITSLQLAGSAKINGLDPAIAAAAVPAVAPRSGSTDEGAAAVDAAAAAAIGEGTEANGPEAAVAAAAGTKSRTSEAAGGVSQPHHPHRSLTPTPAALTVLAPGSRALAHAGNGSGAATAADEDSRTQAQLQALIRSKCQSLDISGLQVSLRRRCVAYAGFMFSTSSALEARCKLASILQSRARSAAAAAGAASAACTNIGGATAASTSIGGDASVLLVSGQRDVGASGAASAAVEQGHSRSYFSKDELRSRVRQGVLAWHAGAVEELKRRQEEARLKRVQALKSSDMEGYLALVREVRSSRLTEMLDQTGACLSTFAKRLGLEKLLKQQERGSQGSQGLARSEGSRSHMALDSSKTSAASSAAGSTATEGGGGVLESSEMWAALSRALVADIAEQPRMLQDVTLRDYQMQGLRWMVALAEHGLSGILADDMGLGKTIQVIALLAHLVEKNKGREASLPHLVAAPASILPNWVAEFERCAPDLKVVVYHGSPPTRDRIHEQQMSRRSNKSPAPFHVLLTTYDYLMGKTDRPRLTKYSWGHIVIDEGHRLKDASCKLATELSFYQSRSRLLLTGTPLQNRLGELWSLLHFLLPGAFGPAEDFEKWFSAPLEALRIGPGEMEGSSSLTEEEFMLATNRLHQVLRPFMLRRLKESVASELPSKTERLVVCAMSPYQRALNSMLQQRLTGSEANGNGQALANSVHNTIMELRKIANHPLLSVLHPPMGEEAIMGVKPVPTTSPISPLVSLCGKMDVLDHMLLRLKARGHKVLLFCTMTAMLDVIESLLDWRGLLNEEQVLRLDGATATADRGHLIERWNETGPGAPWLFLLSLRAGGVGLNLQAADTIIMYDSDWNPQADLQAQARAHRIGQKREVLVLRLMTEGSVEKHIIQVAEEKKRFADSSITGGFFDNQTAPEERRAFLIKLLQESSTASAFVPGDDQGARTLAVGSSEADLDRVLQRGNVECQVQQAQQQQQQQQGQGQQHGQQGQDKALQCLQHRQRSPSTRLLSAELVEPLVSLMRTHNQPRNPDEGKTFGKGQRSANALLSLKPTASAAKANVALTSKPTTHAAKANATLSSEPTATAAKAATGSMRKATAPAPAQPKALPPHSSTTPASDAGGGPSHKEHVGAAPRPQQIHPERPSRPLPAAPAAAAAGTHAEVAGIKHGPHLGSAGSIPTTPHHSASPLTEPATIPQSSAATLQHAATGFQASAAPPITAPCPNAPNPNAADPTTTKPTAAGPTAADPTATEPATAGSLHPALPQPTALAAAGPAAADPTAADSPSLCPALPLPTDPPSTTTPITEGREGPSTQADPPQPADAPPDPSGKPASLVKTTPLPEAGAAAQPPKPPLSHAHTASQKGLAPPPKGAQTCSTKPGKEESSVASRFLAGAGAEPAAAAPPISKTTKPRSKMAGGASSEASEQSAMQAPSSSTAARSRCSMGATVTRRRAAEVCAAQQQQQQQQQEQQQQQQQQQLSPLHKRGRSIKAATAAEQAGNAHTQHTQQAQQEGCILGMTGSAKRRKVEMGAGARQTSAEGGSVPAQMAAAAAAAVVAAPAPPSAGVTAAAAAAGATSGPASKTEGPSKRSASEAEESSSGSGMEDLTLGDAALAAKLQAMFMSNAAAAVKERRTSLQHKGIGGGSSGGAMHSKSGPGCHTANNSSSRGIGGGSGGAMHSRSGPGCHTANNSSSTKTVSGAGRGAAVLGVISHGKGAGVHMSRVRPPDGNRSRKGGVTSTQGGGKSDKERAAGRSASSPVAGTKKGLRASRSVPPPAAGVSRGPRAHSREAAGQGRSCAPGGSAGAEGAWVPGEGEVSESRADGAGGAAGAEGAGGTAGAEGAGVTTTEAFVARAEGAGGATGAEGAGVKATEASGARAEGARDVRAYTRGTRARGLQGIGAGKAEAAAAEVAEVAAGTQGEGCAHSGQGTGAARAPGVMGARVEGSRRAEAEDAAGEGASAKGTEAAHAPGAKGARLEGSRGPKAADEAGEGAGVKGTGALGTKGVRGEGSGGASPKFACTEGVRAPQFRTRGMLSGKAAGVPQGVSESLSGGRSGSAGQERGREAASNESGDKHAARSKVHVTRGARAMAAALGIGGQGGGKVSKRVSARSGRGGSKRGAGMGEAKCGAGKGKVSRARGGARKQPTDKAAAAALVTSPPSPALPVTAAATAAAEAAGGKRDGTGDDAAGQGSGTWQQQQQQQLHRLIGTPAATAAASARNNNSSSSSSSPMPDFMSHLAATLEQDYGYTGSLDGWTFTAVLHAGSGAGSKRWYPTFRHPHFPGHSFRSFKQVAAAVVKKDQHAAGHARKGGGEDNVRLQQRVAGSSSNNSGGKKRSLGSGSGISKRVKN